MIVFCTPTMHELWRILEQMFSLYWATVIFSTRRGHRCEKVTLDDKSPRVRPSVDTVGYSKVSKLWYFYLRCFL